jgi:transposase
MAGAKGKSGRKPLLDEELIQKIESLAARGAYDYNIYESLGIGHNTFYTWLKKGEEPGQPAIYRELRDRLKKAEAFRELKWVETIDKDDSWQSKAWLLERRFPDRWAKKEQLQIQGDHTVRLEVDYVSDWREQPLPLPDNGQKKESKSSE